MKKEWDALRTIGAWNEKEVQDWDSVRKRANGSGAKADAGRVSGICIEKGSELPPGHAGRNTKEE